MTESDAQEVLQALDVAIAAVARAEEPYWTAVELAGLACSSMIEHDVALHLYLVWSALCDWYELKPEEEREAVAAMHRAAAEWGVAADGAARNAYLDRWMYDELGYERRS